MLCLSKVRFRQVHDRNDFICVLDLWPCDLWISTLVARVMGSLGSNIFMISCACSLPTSRRRHWADRQHSYWQPIGGRFVKQEQWERWRAQRKLVSGSKHRKCFCRGPGVLPPEKFWDLYAKFIAFFGRKMVRNAVHSNRNVVPRR